MPVTWGAIRRSLSCQLSKDEVYNPVAAAPKKNLCCRKNCAAGCTSCSSLSHLKDKVHGNSRRDHKANGRRSSMSFRANELINLVFDQIRLSHLGSGNQIRRVAGDRAETEEARSLKFCSLPGQRVSHSRSYSGLSPSGYDHRSKSSFVHYREGGGGSSRLKIATCQICGEDFSRLETFEAHHFLKHAVTDLIEGDTSWAIIDKIVRSGWPRSANPLRITRILKVNHLQTTLAKFEEHREVVKIRANRLSDSENHPRCLADGNELLRFHGTTISCSLGRKDASSSSSLTTLCRSDQCQLCCILRDGFKTRKITVGRQQVEVFTTSTSKEAYKSVHVDVEKSHYTRKALIVCRVIAGRVRRPMDASVDEAADGHGFDSIARKDGVEETYIEQLFLLSSSAVLPCFVIVCNS